MTGGEGGLVARAVSTKGAFQGLSQVLLPGAPSRAVLLLTDGKGGDANFGQPVTITEGSVHAKLAVRGSAAEASVGTVTLKGHAAGSARPRRRRDSREGGNDRRGERADDPSPVSATSAAAGAAEAAGR